MKFRFGFFSIALLLTACTPSTNSGENISGDSSQVNIDSTDALLQQADSTLPSIVVTDSSAKDSSRRQYIEGAFTVPAAMEVIFGLYDKEIECAKWVCKPVEKRRFSAKTDPNGMLHTRAAGAYPINSKEGRKMLLLTETLSREKNGWENCHACAPILGAAMFQEIDGAWFIEALQKDLDVIGAWGELPSNKLVTFGPEMQGVLFSYGSNGQGISENGIELIGVVDGKFKVLLDKHTAYSNEGMFGDPKEEPKAYSYDSDLNFKEIEPGKPWQLTLVRHGKRPVDGVMGDGKVEAFSEELVFRLEGGSYVMVDSVVGE